MLFFFELFLFVLVLMTLALGEFVSHWLALILWLVVAATAIGGYFLALRALRPLLAREHGAPEDGAREGGPTSERMQLSERTEPPASEGNRADIEPTSATPTPLDAKWARTLLYNWRRTNVLLVLGAVVVAGWYWFAG
jgi:hypothetical protein